MDKNIFRIGKVSSIDYKTGMINVVYTDKDNATTTKFPYANFNNEYCMPKIGEQVIVAHLSNGTSRGVVLGTMWNKKNIPAENGKQLYRKDFSKTPGAAYTRYNDENGEYLVRMPIILLHGVDRTDLEGPEVNIAANLRTSFESPEHTAALGSICVSGLENGDITAEILSNMSITMDMADLEALIMNVRLEAVEEMKLAAGKDIHLEDANFSTTLSQIMERLEALDGDTSARK